MTTYNFNFYQGETFNAQLTARDSSNNTLNLSGYNARGYVRYNHSASGILYDLQPVITGAATGLLSVIAPATGTAVLPVGKFYYDIEVYDSTSVTKLLNGYVIVNPEYTR